jgi:hypothetical protein
MCYLANANAAKLKKRDFVKLADQMGVVLLDVNWGRKWACGDYENAQLVSLRFEKTSRRPDEHDKYTEIVLKTPSRLFVNPVFLNYGFLVEPGTYAFTGWSVKVAKSATDVGLIKATRKELVEGGEFYGGTFSVGASEVIYVGNFHLDCYYSPIPWRYYTADKNDFADHIDQYKDEFKFLQDTKVEFRLLETENYGTSYVLPE